MCKMRWWLKLRLGKYTGFWKFLLLELCNLAQAAFVSFVENVVYQLYVRGVNL